MLGRRSNARPKIERQVMPSGCQGRPSILVETTQPNRQGTFYKITTQLGCVGLDGYLVDVGGGTYKRNATDAPNKERRHFEYDALRQSAGQIVAKCAQCPLGLEWQKARAAQQMRDNPDDLATRVEIAQAERAAAHERVEAASLELQLRQQQK